MWYAPVIFDGAAENGIVVDAPPLANAGAHLQCGSLLLLLMMMMIVVLVVVIDGAPNHRW